jgi:hypothetical protein
MRLGFRTAAGRPRRARRFRLAGCLVAPLLLAGCAGGQQPLPTVDGPEAPELVQQVQGYVVMNGHGEDDVPDGLMVAVALPSRKSQVLIKSPPRNGADTPTLHALSGPDAEGRIAYVEDHFFVPTDKDRRHLLKVIRIDGTNDTELFSRPGDAMWARHGEIGHALALSPTRGRVAFLSGLQGVQMPGALLSAGSIEIWDIAKKAGHKADVTAVDDPLSWFPDGKRLAYVELVPPKEMVKPASEPEDFGAGFKGWEKVPAVHVLDTDTGKRTFLHLGWQPIVSSDGKSVLVQDFDNRLRLVTVADGKSQAVKLPGYWGRSLALLEGSRVLYWGLPTTGSPPRFTKYNSPLAGPKPMPSLKVADINSDKFHTVLPYLDPRDVISFGKVEGPR